MRSPFRRLQWIVISWVNPRTYRAVIRCGGLLILAGFAIAIADARSDEPAKAAASGRAIEGVVTATGGKPLAGARVLLCEFGRGMVFVDEATATTDAQGRYRVDLSKLEWSAGPIRELVLAQGFEIGDRKLAPGESSADFTLAEKPWKETLVRLEDESGKPVAGVEVTFKLGEAIWSRPTTSTEGSCRVAMAPELWVSVETKPPGARPVETILNIRKDGPASITLPVLAPIKGRVLDQDGKPVPDVAVGRWINFRADGTKKMLTFFNGAHAVTDQDGRFTVAPEVNLKGSSAEDPKAPHMPQALCFADPSFRRTACRLFDPTGPSAPMEVRLEPAQLVRVPIKGESLAKFQGQLSAQFFVVPRSDAPDLSYFFITQSLDLKGRTGELVLEEYLPKGTYEIEVRHQDRAAGATPGKATGHVVVPGGEGSIDAPPLVLGPQEHAEMFGKPAPELAAIDLDTGKPVTLADFRGKVVVLDFWGYWCGPCTGSMPHLMDLYAKFKGRPLEIVALHDQSVQSRAEYDQKIAPARRIMWSGRDLPFRVLLDCPDPKKPDDRQAEGTGTTINRYVIRAFPTLFVIGPDGTLVDKVARSQHERLETLVRELLDKAR